ncbi:MAG: efflux RND transporter periplasmic adaptor subunit [Lentimicrobiaceae bacterium]|jgi:HlyD family secretion protein
MKRKKIILYSTIILAVLAIGYWFLRKEKTLQVMAYTTAEVKIGSVVNTVTATGSIQPVKQVDVGTQVSGVIKKIYVDFNSDVKKGQLLAELDKTPLLQQLASTEADLQMAKVQLTYQEDNYNRIKALFDKKAISETDYETALYQYGTAKANLDNMKASVGKAQTNLGYTMIYSPINGVVLNRAVVEGQTVASSFNTPTLFTIAQDLTKMQVLANVDEADIGQVKDGQKVVFTVDAFPGENFKGTITQIRLQPITNSNVVTYSVVVDAPNPELKLKPGLTASITAYAQEADSVLIIPAKALHFKPDSTILAKYNMSSGKWNRQSSGRPNYNGDKTHNTTGKWKAPSETDSLSKGVVWIKTGDSIQPRHVITGLTDETNVEIKRGLKLGESVIVSMEQVSSKAVKTQDTETSSPFMPKRPKR